MPVRPYRNRAEAIAVRTEACRCAATVLAHRTDLDVVPIAFSMCEFFESYIASGAEVARESWGPEKPVELKMVRS